VLQHVVVETRSACQACAVVKGKLPMLHRLCTMNVDCRTACMGVQAYLSSVPATSTCTKGWCSASMPFACAQPMYYTSHQRLDSHAWHTCCCCCCCCCHQTWQRRPSSCNQHKLKSHTCNVSLPPVLALRCGPACTNNAVPTTRKASYTCNFQNVKLMQRCAKLSSGL
jgi:hypothetical protein